MLLRFTNGALLALLIVLTLTGLWGLAFTLQGWVVRDPSRRGLGGLCLGSLESIDCGSGRSGAASVGASTAVGAS